TRRTPRGERGRDSGPRRARARGAPGGAAQRPRQSPPHGRRGARHVRGGLGRRAELSRRARVPVFMPMAVERAIRRAWRRQGVDGRLLHLGLLPLSALFATAVELRAASYKLRLRRPRQLAAAVVSVGNLAVGGTGKTPTTLWLAESLRD